MVKILWIHFPQCFFFSTNIGNCWITNKDWKDFLKSGHTHWLKKYHLKLKNLKKIKFVNKNWHNNPRICCKSHCNLVEFIEVDFKEELEKIENEFELDEIWN